MTIKDLAKILRERLSDDEYLFFLDVSGDYATDSELYRELSALKPKPEPKE
jgi:hypothetical protein